MGSRLTWSPQLRQPKKAGELLESMFLLFLVAAQASASPVVVPGGDLLLPGHQNLLRSIALPYYPVYPFINWRLITQGVVIDIDVDYTCEKEGVFINEEDCGSYFVCNDNGAGLKPTKVNCPGVTADGGNVLAFNNVTGACDWAVNVPGCGGVRQYEPQPVEVDPFFDYDCTAEGIFYNPEDCGSYVVCNSDNEGGIGAAKVSCPPNLLFNAELKVCDWPENVPDCALRTVASHPDGAAPTAQPVVACTQDAEGRITGPTPCVEAIIACADGSFRIDCDPVSETWWWSAEEDPEDFDCSGKSMGVYEHPDQCNMYYVCTSEGRAFRHTCAEGTLFSVATGECMFEEEVVCKGRNEKVFELGR